MKRIFYFLLASWISISSHAQPGIFQTSHYLLPEFTQGTVLMKDGKRNDALLNYNSLTEEMIFDKGGTKLAIGKNQIPRIDTVFIEDRKFVVLNNSFVELLYHAQWELFIEYKCKLQEAGTPVGYGGTSQTSAVKSVSTLTQDGRVFYDLKLPDEYKTKPSISYKLRKDGVLHEFKSEKELKKLFAEKKDEIKKYSKSNRVKFQEPETIVQIIAFLESS